MLSRINLVVSCILLLLLLSQLTNAVPKQNFYPYGPAYGDFELAPWDDHSSEELQLTVPICFYGQCYKTIFVNSNGLASFVTELPSYANTEITNLGYPVIAIFYADVDISPDGQNGRILYRTTDHEELLQKSSEMVQSKFYPDGADYQARLLLIATWDSVGRYSAQTDKKNSFQLIISTNGTASYAEFLYADQEINWIDSTDKFPNTPNPLSAQAGFAAPNSLPYFLPQSNAPTMAQITEQSNVGLPGVFLYRISDKEIEGKMNGDDEDDEYEDYVQESEEGTADDNQEGDDVEEENQANNNIYQATAQCPIDPRMCQQQGCHVRMDRDGCAECLCDHDRQQSENIIPTVLPACHDDPYRGICPEDCPLIVQGNCQRCYCHGVEPNARAPEQRRNMHPPSYYGGDQCYDCHSQATCEAYGAGSCCRCRSGFVGDGRECVKEDEAQRVSGRLRGRLNGMDITDSELHTYAVLSDGRTYTAFSNIPTELGPPMLLLRTLGSVMGWMFAKPLYASVENGFTLTGGRFNRSVTVHVADRYMVTIQQDFQGRDEYQYLKCDTYVSGTLPMVPPQATVDFGEHLEEFVRADQGVVKSYSTMVANVGENRYPVITDQMIRFQPCRHLPYRADEKLLLRVDRSYSVYDQGEQIVRYASGNSMEMPGAAVPHENPCREGAHDCHGHNMDCVAEGDRYRCVCRQGYQMQISNEVDRRMTCTDVDECRENSHRCDSNADCHNIDGGYLCQCHQGFEGDGYRCTRVNLCGTEVCSQDAYCLPDSVTGMPECVCRAGFSGSGLVCRPSGYEPEGALTAQPFSGLQIDGAYGQHSCQQLRCGPNSSCRPDHSGIARCICDPGYEMAQDSRCYPTAVQQPEQPPPGTICRSHEECSKYGHCVYNEAINHYQCQCRAPYSGDGVQCFLEAETCEHSRNCHPNADCIYEQREEGVGGYRCRCRAGYTGTGYDCRPLEQMMEQIQCNVMNNCNPKAECILDPASNRHRCRCLPGYSGDGYTCRADAGSQEITKQSCQGENDCHLNAHCVVDERTEQYVCECLPGFKGDGKNYCEPADECNPGADHHGCALHAACVYSDRIQAYTCQCMHGYTGDGKTCTEMQMKDCSIDRALCHRDADCTYDHHVNGYVCKCNSGYQGDGYYSCQPVQTTICDRQNVCDRNARCVPTPDGTSYSCMCKEGYDGDGYRCHQVTDCVATPSMCDENADCVSENMRYACRCKPGYHGSGFTCRPDSKVRGKNLIFSHGMSLVQRGLQPEDYGKQLVVVPYQIAVGVDFDCSEDKIYWTDVSGHSIRSANLDGSDVTVMFDTELSSPEGICIDPVNRNLYYTDSVRDEIVLVSLKTKSRIPIATDGLYNPRALAIDPVDRKLYYSDWHRQRPVIGRMNLDGTGREPYVTSDIALPNGLVVLPRRRELCWADAGMQRLECMGVSHTGRHVVHAPLGYPFGLTIHNEETFYWTDWEDKRIHSVSIYSGDHQTMMPAAGGSGKLYGIIAIPSECFAGESACMANNGGCKYVCIPDGYGSRRCLCPEGVSEAECNQV